jgi:hypothetical protein
MIGRRPQVLSQGDDVDMRAAQVIHGLEDLVVGFAEAQHQARLGEHAWAMPLGVREHRECLRVACACVTHRVRQAPHGLEVLRKYLQAGIDDGLNVPQCALEIRSERLHGRCGRSLADRAHAGCEVPGAAVTQVIAVDAGQHDIRQPHERHAFGHVGRLVGIEPPARVASVHGTEAARPRADCAHQHDGRSAGVPALTDVGALCFLAYRGQPVLVHVAAYLLVPLPGSGHGPQPAGLAGERRRRHLGARLLAIAYGREPLRGGVFLAAARAGSER